MHLRRMREDRGMTLEELADHSGLSFRGVVYIEHGQRNPSLTTLLTACMSSLPGYWLFSTSTRGRSRRLGPRCKID
ncbi:helix-turn-helix domain-containing protein [Streptomyces canus]|uniref:helix-turn-helix domain-containing protein n=1 Tax=Streptomyces canus TaxID=58343 RepID=UPI003820C65E